MAITPSWPKPLPYTANLLRRLARGWSSWFGLLNEWDFRISLGDLNLLGLRVFLVNDRSLLRRVLSSALLPSLKDCLQDLPSAAAGAADVLVCASGAITTAAAGEIRVRRSRSSELLGVSVVVRPWCAQGGSW